MEISWYCTLFKVLSLSEAYCTTKSSSNFRLHPGIKVHPKMRRTQMDLFFLFEQYIWIAQGFAGAISFPWMKLNIKITFHCNETLQIISLFINASLFHILMFFSAPKPYESWIIAVSMPCFPGQVRLQPLRAMGAVLAAPCLGAPRLIQPSGAFHPTA